jgi:hypothetical protein
MDNFLSAPELFDDFTKKQIYCCSTVRPNMRGMPQDLAPKTTKVERGDIRIRTMDYLMAILRQHWRYIHADEYSQCPRETSLLQ